MGPHSHISFQVDLHKFLVSLMVIASTDAQGNLIILYDELSNNSLIKIHLKKSLKILYTHSIVTGRLPLRQYDFGLAVSLDDFKEKKIIINSLY